MMGSTIDGTDDGVEEILGVINEESDFLLIRGGLGF